ncbi:23S rRNA (pseudouridine(1915)-N(3))-methyltransferase RlmH [Arachidicoccus soli]|uniref:Ribosomal RNA large subunit methyltransferase H n=1 Tax=Arachidicoccus soli TaxID=2341117 RepID=A0A386HMW1_9BACT|nr:23S rRNA (pseudouridine(1915)-N(3))-methyltransferase RlmH [Arachidicoccus soli]AYD47012.1 23S rRNA (pseudouridine(1915)-N(3))-methyltransferase RlmH [Arachidicoccus soli]
MKILLYSVGKPHDSYVKQGIEEFTKRLNKYFQAEWKIIAPPKNAASLNEAELKKQEAKLILGQLNAEDFLVLLDERGKQFSSPQLANFIQQRANESTKVIVFLIGGAYGVDELVFERANFSLSLSSLVFPHMLVRLVLAEQVYRACTILRNEKYHHS